MRKPAWLIAGLITITSLLVAVPKGSVPRSAATLYPVHAEQDGFKIGARLLSPDEARRTFVSDVNRCCLVIELALYPPKDQTGEVSLDDVSLRITGTENAAKPSTPKVVAARLQKKAREIHDITVSPSVGVGYGSGTTYDPATGTRRGGGIYTQTGVAVGIGSPTDQPASSDRDRSVMETELGEKGLPEGSFRAPVAGYLYFALPYPSKKNTPLQLEYTLNGKKLVLFLP